MRSLKRGLLVSVMVLLPSVAAWAQAPDFKDIGRPATPQEVKGWDLTVLQTGDGLWPGHGTAKEGRPIFKEKCAVCHGEEGQGDFGPRVAGGPGRPLGSKGPFATSVWQIIRRSMPLAPLEPMVKRTTDPNAPLEPSGFPVYPGGLLTQFAGEDVLLKTGVNPFLTMDEIYALTAFILYKSDIITEEAVMDQNTLPKVKMPNLFGYLPMNPDGTVPEWKWRDPATRIEPHVSPKSKPLPPGSSPVNVVK